MKLDWLLEWGRRERAKELESNPEQKISTEKGQDGAVTAHVETEVEEKISRREVIQGMRR